MGSHSIRRKNKPGIENSHVKFEGIEVKTNATFCRILNPKKPKQSCFRGTNRFLKSIFWQCHYTTI